MGSRDAEASGGKAAVVVIAIDGPAASGKSTTALAVAEAIGASHLDSGAMYRAVTVLALSLGTLEADALLKEAERRKLTLRIIDQGIVPYLDGKEAEPLLRSPEVNALVSQVSALPEVREWVNSEMRAAVERGLVAMDARSRKPTQAVVLDGRDIGTAVFPGAPVKVFLTASPEVRAARRLAQQGRKAHPDEIAREAAVLTARDRQDQARTVAPLRRAADAEVLDTSRMRFQEQVQAIVELIRRRLPDLLTPA